MSKLLLKAIICLITATSPMHALAASMYIDDNLRVGVRAEPGNNTAPHKVLNTGDKLEVIKEDGQYSKIQAEDGTEGWVRNLYLTPTLPARIRLAEIQTELIRANEDIIHLQKQLEAANHEKQDQLKRMDLLNTDIYNLHQKLASLDPNTSQQWIYLIIIILTLSALSFTVGILWHKQQVAKKLGGHSL